MDLIKRILNEDNVLKLEAENMYMMGEIMAAIETVKKENAIVLQKLENSENLKAELSLLKAQISAMEETHKTEIANLRTNYENKISEIRKLRNRARNEESFEENQNDQKDPFSFTSMYTMPQFNWQSSQSCQREVENTSSNSAEAEITTKPVDEITAKNENDKGLWLYLCLTQK